MDTRLCGPVWTPLERATQVRGNERETPVGGSWVCPCPSIDGTPSRASLEDHNEAAVGLVTRMCSEASKGTAVLSDTESRTSRGGRLESSSGGSPGGSLHTIPTAMPTLPTNRIVAGTCAPLALTEPAGPKYAKERNR